MTFDMHVHVAPDAHSFTRRPFMRLFARGISANAACFNDRLRDYMSTAPTIDRFVLLALDSVYAPNGDPDPRHTAVHVPNAFVAGVAKSHPKALFGASVHPYRRDAIAALDAAIADGECLVKWIPSTQRIRPDGARCRPFYERLAAAGVPLLVHTGIEHATAWHTPRAMQQWNHPRRLRLLPLLDALLAIARDRGLTMLAIGFDARDPRLPPVLRRYTPFVYRTRLYAVHWPGVSAPVEPDGRLLYPDIALL